MRRWLVGMAVITLGLFPSAFAFAQTATPAPTATPDYRGLVEVGFIQMSAAPFMPAGWIEADGSCLSQAAYPRLYNVYGTTYGVCDGVTEFGIPDLRGRVMVASGTGSGLTNRYLAETGGNETHTLTITEMPSHNHGVTDPGHTHRVPKESVTLNAGVNVAQPAARTDNAAAPHITTNSSTTGISINNTGGGAAFSLMQPYFVLNFYIWTGATALSVASPSEIDVTVVVVFPTHTATPTLTPSATPTAGPSPTATATASPTPNYVTSYVTSDGQAGAFIWEVSAGEFLVSTLLFALFFIAVVSMFTKAREDKPDVA